MDSRYARQPETRLSSGEHLVTEVRMRGPILLRRASTFQQLAYPTEENHSCFVEHPNITAGRSAMLA